jgi:nicotinate-nucleotide adenylyltransferase
VKKLAIFGGSFDPIHNAHIQMSLFALKNFELSKLIFVPAFMSPHKTNQDYAPAKDRLKMLELASKHIPKTDISTYEIEKNEPVFTYQTLDYFQAIYDSYEIYMLLGSDSFLNLQFWKKIDYIASKFRFIVAKRLDYPIVETSKFLNICEFLGEGIENISSSQIKFLIKNKDENVKNFLDKKVCTYITQKRLYL